MIDFKRFCNDFNIQYALQGQYKRDGWTNILCPICLSSNMVLGIHNNGACCCYKCGNKSLKNIIWHLTKKNPDVILEKYASDDLISSSVIHAEVCELPSSIPLTKAHRDYLTSRDFSYKEILYNYSISSADYLTDYKNRIIIPIYYRGKLVSYTCRAGFDSDGVDYGGVKYLTCKNEDEVIPHKSILYNLDNCNSDRILIVEGPTDVWRIGKNCAGTFSMTYSAKQVLHLLQYATVFILYDNSIKAQQQADKLLYDIKFLNSRADVEIVDIGGDYDDPGSMKDYDVKCLKKYLDI